MLATCAATGKQFEITANDQRYYDRLKVPYPTLCPDERNRRRMAFRNFRSLYRRKCDATAEPIISMYSADVPFPVVTPDYWWSDNWDAKDHAISIDLQRSFFEQYAELSRKVPRYSIMNLQSENCNFSNMVMNSRNCYLVFGCVGSEDCMYGHIVWESNNCLDNCYAYRCNWCSNCVDIVECYDAHYSQEAANCSESYFLYDCRNCQNCFCCSNLRNKQYYFLNQPLSKADYQRKLAEYFPQSAADIDTWRETLAQLQAESAIFPPSISKNAENISGNHIFNSSNAHNCFDTKAVEDCAYCYTVNKATDCYDLSFTGGGVELCLDCLTVADSNNVCYSHQIIGSHDVAYSEFCYNSHNLFGCIGLKNAEYCIFNKQYSKEDYQNNIAAIIAAMKSAKTYGEFFPIYLSPFAYNESIVNEYYPLSKEQAVAAGLRWIDDDAEAISQTKQDNIPTLTDQNWQEIPQQTYNCAITAKAFRITSKELDFHRKLKLPLPTLCPDARHDLRMSYREPQQLWPSRCANCQSTISTPFASKPAASCYCEQCYLEIVYQ